MYAKAINPIKNGFSTLIDLLFENLDQKIKKLLQNKSIADFVELKNQGNYQGTPETFLKKIANQFDPTPDKKYLEFILRSWMMEDIQGFEDAAEVRGALVKYIKAAARNTPGINKDINSYKSIAGLYEYLHTLETQQEDKYAARKQIFNNKIKSYPGIEFIADIPNGYRLFKASKPPEKEPGEDAPTSIFSEPDICQGYWCIKSPAMRSYYPLWFLEKNGFIELAVVPNANQIRNPFNSNQFNAEQLEALKYLYFNWRKIKESSGGKFFDMNEPSGDFEDLRERIEYHDIANINEQVFMQEISELKDKYNEPYKFPDFQSIEKEVNFLKTKRYSSLKPEILNKINSILRKDYVQNNSMQDKLKYHWFYYNISIFFIELGNIYQGLDWFSPGYILEPFLPPSSANSLKAITTLYLNNFDKLFLQSRPKEGLITDSKKGSYSISFMFIMGSNAALYSKSGDTIGTYNLDKNKIENDVATVSKLVSFHGAEKVTTENSLKQTKAYTDFIRPMNNDFHEFNIDKFYDWFFSTEYSEKFAEKEREELSKQLYIKKPNEHIISSSGELFKKITSFTVANLLSLPAHSSQSGYWSHQNSMVENFIGGKYNIYQAIKDVYGDLEAAPNTSMVYGGISELYQEIDLGEETMDVNTALGALFALNYNVVNGDLEHRSRHFNDDRGSYFTSGVTLGELPSPLKFTGKLNPDTTKKVLRSLYDVMEKMEQAKMQGDLSEDTYTKESFEAIKRLKRVFSPDNPSSLIIGTSCLIPYQTYDRRDSKKNLTNINDVVVCNNILNQYIFNETLKKQYGKAYYPENIIPEDRLYFYVSVLRAYNTTIPANSVNMDDIYNIIENIVTNLNLLDKATYAKVMNVDVSNVPSTLGYNNYFAAAVKQKPEIIEQLFNIAKKNKVRENILVTYYARGTKPIKAPAEIEEALNLKKIKKYADTFYKGEKPEVKMEFVDLKTPTLDFGKYKIPGSLARDVGYYKGDPYEIMNEVLAKSPVSLKYLTDFRDKWGAQFKTVYAYVPKSAATNKFSKYFFAGEIMDDEQEKMVPFIIIQKPNSMYGPDIYFEKSTALLRNFEDQLRWGTGSLALPYKTKGEKNKRYVFRATLKSDETE